MTDTIEKIYFSIGEVAKQFNTTQSALRFYENDFGKLASYQSKRGHRKFTTHDVERVRYLMQLFRVDKYTIPGAVVKFLERYPPRKNKF